MEALRRASLDEAQGTHAFDAGGRAHEAGSARALDAEGRAHDAGSAHARDVEEPHAIDAEGQEQAGQPQPDAGSQRLERIVNAVVINRESPPVYNGNSRVELAAWLLPVLTVARDAPLTCEHPIHHSRASLQPLVESDQALADRMVVLDLGPKHLL